MKAKFKNLQIIFLALLLGQLAFAVIANFMITDTTFVDTGALIYLVPTVIVVGIVAGTYIFKDNLKKVVAKKSTPDEKFKEYRKSSIIRWAMLETGNLLAIIAAIIEGNGLYFIMFGFGLLFFSTTRPNAVDFMKRMELSAKDID